MTTTRSSIVQRIATTAAAAALTSMLVAAATTYVRHNREDNEDENATNGIPGSNGIVPLVGDTIQFAIDPRRYVAEGFDRYGGLAFRGFVANKKIVFVRGPELAEFVYDNAELFSNEQLDTFKNLLEGFLLIQSGDEHRRNRKLVVHALSTRELRQNLCFIATEFDQEIDEFKQNPVVEIYAAIKRIVLRVMMRVLVGVNATESKEDARVLERLIHAFEEYGCGFFGLPLDLGNWNDHGRALLARKEILSYFRDLVDQRRSGERQTVRRDLLQTLIDYVDEETGQPADSETIAKNVLVLLFASIDTTTSSAASIIVALNDHDHVRELVYKEIHEKIGDDLVDRARAGDVDCVFDKLNQLEYMDCVIKEILRMRTPLLGSYRTAKQDVVLPGTNFIVPKDWMVCVSQVYSMTTDDRHFPNPSKFAPERFLPGTGVSYEAGSNFKGPLFPFSLGAHTCPGFRFAITELKLLVALIVTKCAEWPRIIRKPKYWVDKPSLEGSDGMDVKFVFHG